MSDEIQKEVAAAYFGGLIRQQNELRYETSQQATMLRLLTKERDDLAAQHSAAQKVIAEKDFVFSGLVRRYDKLFAKHERLKKAKKRK